MHVAALPTYYLGRRTFISALRQPCRWVQHDGAAFPFVQTVQIFVEVSEYAEEKLGCSTFSRCGIVDAFV